MTEEIFSGFMPMIGQVTITSQTSMIDNEGDLLNAHTFKIEAKDGSEYVFSILNYDLMRLYFLIGKIISDQK